MSSRFLSFLQDRFDALLVAIGTYVMDRFGVLHLWLYAVHKRSLRQWVQLVTLLLLFPVFELHNIGFKLAYTARQRRIVRLGGKQLMLNVSNYSVQFHGLARYRRISLEREQTLRNLRCSLQGAKGPGNQVHHDVSPR